MKILWDHLFYFVSSPTDIFLEGEEETFFSVQEDKVYEETMALLRKKSQNDAGHKYKLGEIVRLYTSHWFILIFLLLLFLLYSITVFECTVSK